MNSTVKYLVTTTRGIEKITVMEAKRLGYNVVRSLSGRIIIEGRKDLFYELNLKLKTAERVNILLIDAQIESLEDIKKVVREADWNFIGRHTTFAVRVERVGKHDFTSVDVAAAIGEAIQDSCEQSHGYRPPVNLNFPQIIINSWMIDNHLQVAIETTGVALHFRGYKVFFHPAGIKPNIAAALLEVANYKQGTIVDPFSGSGTILIEAAHRIRNIHNGVFRNDFHFKHLPNFDPDKYRKILRDLTREINNKNEQLIGIERISEFIEGGKLNMKKSFTANTIQYIESDFRDAEWPEHVDFVITNPPYGIRMGRNVNLRAIYGALAKKVREYPDIKIGVIVGNKKFIKMFKSFTLEFITKVFIGDIQAFLMLYRI